MSNSVAVDKITEVLDFLKANVQIPIGVSNRHIHLSQEDYQTLFPNEKVEILKDLTQPGFFAAKQFVTIAGPRGEIGKVRLLGPLRNATQVEISKTDSRALGIDAPIRVSGDLKDACEIIIRSPHAEIKRRAAIVAKRHIHMNLHDALLLGFKSGDVVKVKVQTGNRTTIFDDVEIRPADKTVLELHVDTDEANAANVDNNTRAMFVCP